MKTSSQNRWNTVAFVQLGLGWGILGGLLETVVRTWLQSLGVTNFGMRLTAVSQELVWFAPTFYAVLFAVLGFCCAIAQKRMPRADLSQVALVSFATLALLPALAASGRISRVSTVLLALGLGVTVNRVLLKLGPARREIWRLGLPWLAGCLLIVGIATEVDRRQVERRSEAALTTPVHDAPNIILIVVDTLRADHLPSYGYARMTAPAISRLAAEGAQFDWAIAASSWTLPSHVSLLTGYYPSAHGAELGGYDNRFPTLGDGLLERGYRTGAISANTLLFSRAQGFGPGFLQFDDSFYSLQDGLFRTFYGHQAYRQILRRLGWTDYPGRRSAEDVTRSAEKWIGKKTGRPFFLMLNYFDAHDPLFPVAPWRGLFSPTGYSGGRRNSYLSSTARRYSPAEVQEEIDAYDGTIAYVDHRIGELLGFLESAGLRDNTAVIVTSDHGESLGQHGLMGHGTSLYIEQIRVPLIVHYPKQTAAGLRIPTPVSQTDLPNTILELAGGEGTIKFPGVSLARYWRVALPAFGAALPISELAHKPYSGSKDAANDVLGSVLDREWHFIQHGQGEPELFDLGADPGETQNVAGRSDMMDSVQRYGAILRQIRKNSP